jgi:hypothetical protein
MTQFRTQISHRCNYDRSSVTEWERHKIPQSQITLIQSHSRSPVTCMYSVTHTYPPAYCWSAASVSLIWDAERFAGRAETAVDWPDDIHNGCRMLNHVGRWSWEIFCNKIKISILMLEVLTVVSMKYTTFWFVTPCSRLQGVTSQKTVLFRMRTVQQVDTTVTVLSAPAPLCQREFIKIVVTKFENWPLLQNDSDITTWG